MYKIIYEDGLLHETGSSAYVVLSPVLTLSDNQTGALTFDVPITNPRYDSLKALKGEVMVYEEDKALFYGRIISISKDFYGNKTVTCEGELGYLLDSIQPQKRYQNQSIYGFLSSILSEHNKQSNYKFYVGMVTVVDPNDSIYRFTNFESTLDVILEKLVKNLGGHLRIRHSGTSRYLDYIAEYENTNSQTIEFGDNLLDIEENLEIEDIATRIIPLGVKQDTEDVPGLEKYLTIESINGGKNYVENPDAVSKFGIITRTVEFNDVTVKENLLRKGREYLAIASEPKISINLKAVDLHMMDKEIESIKIGDRIHVVSRVHGLDRFFTCQSLTIHLDNPLDNTFQIGSKESQSLSSRNIQASTEIKEQIEALPKKIEILDEARANATAMITAATTGYVVTRANELLIMDTSDINTARKVWRWNINGLGYSKTGYRGTYSTAMTMDGSIVADFITTGTLNANLIKAGILKDLNGNMEWNLSTGSISAKRLAIDSPNFKLTSYGYLTATGAEINGSITTTSGSSKMRLSSGKVNIYSGDIMIGGIGSNYMKDRPELLGLVFDLENKGAYMSWSVEKTEDAGAYTTVWTYSRAAFGDWTANTLHAGCDIDMHGFKLRNVSWPDGGITGTMDFVKINQMSSDGTVASWNNNCRMVFKNGILISGAF